MPKSKDTPQEAMNSLEERLDAFEAKRADTSHFALGGAAGMGAGYRMVWEIASGLLGGAALGWAVDYFLGTTPWGVAAGVIIGSGLAVFLAAKTAARMGAQALTKTPAQPVPFDDDDD